MATCIWWFIQTLICLLQISDHQPFGLIEEGKTCQVCYYNVVPLFQLQCGHYKYCKGCKEKLLGEYDTFCYICRRKVLFLGNQPTGHMTCRRDSGPSLPGYEAFETIVLGFNFDRGIQGTLSDYEWFFYCWRQDLTSVEHDSQTAWLEPIFQNYSAKLYLQRQTKSIMIHYSRLISTKYKVHSCHRKIIENILITCLFHYIFI